MYDPIILNSGDTCTRGGRNVKEVKDEYTFPSKLVPINSDIVSEHESCNSSYYQLKGRLS